jgi:hypothetical protein
MSVYLIKRGPRPEYHRAPFHPVIICGKRKVAKVEAGWTGDAAYVWEHERNWHGGGWLLARWKGFDVDYGHVVRACTMPDGSSAAFQHEMDAEPWTLLNGAVWWDDKKMPEWLAKAGVVYPSDDFSQQSILDLIADDGAMGCRRNRPSHWPSRSEETT